jgi:hypothetical protein
LKKLTPTNVQSIRYLSGWVDVPDGFVVGRRRVGHEPQADDGLGLVEAELERRQRLEQRLRGEEDHQLAALHRPEQLAAAADLLDGLALDELAAVVGFDLPSKFNSFYITDP